MPTFDEDLIVNGKIRARDGVSPTTDDWEIVRNREHLEIREPEQGNKVWAKFNDNQSLHLIGTPNLLVDGYVGVGQATQSPRLATNPKIEISSPWDDWMFLRQERNVDDGGGFHIHNSWGNSDVWQGADDRNRLGIGYRTPDGKDLWGQFVLHGPTGNVGIGTVKPGEKLHVSGNIQVTGDIILENADCAEEFDIFQSQVSEPGTVMVIDDEGSLRPSEKAYDKKVAGVISGAGSYKPGLILDRQQSKINRQPIALIGKVYCKVDADSSSIEVGDLLTTSAIPGHAMKGVIKSVSQHQATFVEMSFQ